MKSQALSSFSRRVLSIHELGQHSPTLWCPLEQNRAKAEQLWDYIVPKTQEFHALSSNLHDRIVVAAWTAGKKQPPRAFPITALDLRFDAKSCGAINDEAYLLRRVSEVQSSIRTGGDLPDWGSVNDAQDHLSLRWLIGNEVYLAPSARSGWPCVPVHLPAAPRSLVSGKTILHQSSKPRLHIPIVFVVRTT